MADPHWETWCLVQDIAGACAFPGVMRGTTISSQSSTNVLLQPCADMGTEAGAVKCPQPNTKGEGGEGLSLTPMQGKEVAMGTCSR